MTSSDKPYLFIPDKCLLLFIYPTFLHFNQPDISAGQFSKIDLAQFSRLKSRLVPAPQPAPSSSQKVVSNDQSANSPDDGNKAS